jgi:putative heme-binding domain-containing protein
MLRRGGEQGSCIAFRFFCKCEGTKPAAESLAVSVGTMDKDSLKQRRQRRRVEWTLAAFALFVFAGAALKAQSSDGSLVPGARRYQEYCAACHGADGKGGDKAASLATSDSVRNRTEAELFRIVHEGTPDGMPPFAQIGDANIAAVVLYLRRLASSSLPPETAAAPAAEGDAKAGRVLYFGRAQCSACHMMKGQGGFAAPDLTAYARNRTAEMVRRAITAPAEESAPVVRFATATTKDGLTLTGLVRYEDAFTLTLQTQDGRFHFLEQKDLTAVRDAGHLLMPRDYGTLLTASELNDVVTFLMVSGKEQDNETGPAR